MPSLEQAESNWRNRKRVRAGPNDSVIMLRAHLRLACYNRGHVWTGPTCARCGDPNPAALLDLDKTGKKDTGDDATTAQAASP